MCLPAENLQHIHVHYIILSVTCLNRLYRVFCMCIVKQLQSYTCRLKQTYLTLKDTPGFLSERKFCQLHMYISHIIILYYSTLGNYWEVTKNGLGFWLVWESHLFSPEKKRSEKRCRDSCNISMCFWNVTLEVKELSKCRQYSHFIGGIQIPVYIAHGNRARVSNPSSPWFLPPRDQTRFLTNEQTR